MLSHRETHCILALYSNYFGKSQPFCRIFDEISETIYMIPAELDILYQDKEFVAGRMSGNERSACLYMRWQTAESRCSCTSGQHSIRSSNHLALTSRFSSSCIHLAFLSCCCPAHFPPATNSSSWYKSFNSLESQVISSKFPPTGWDSPE